MLRNATLSVQRRWNNLTADAGRQAAIDAFLGLGPSLQSSTSEASGSLSALERLPPAYLCAGAEVPPEHESDGEEGAEEEAAAPTPVVRSPPPLPQPTSGDENDVEGIRAALAASSVGGSEASGERQERELLHPLDG